MLPALLALWVTRLAVSDRGGKYGFVYKSRQKVYRALRRQGKPKALAAAIANAGRSHLDRSRMAKKAARTRKAKGGGRKR